MIDILFCGNDGVFDGVLTCALSILMRTETTEPFCFHIFTMDVSHLGDNYTCITKEHIDTLNKAVKQFNAQNSVRRYDVTKYYMKAFSGCPNESAYCSPYTLIRLFADVVKGIPDKLLFNMKLCRQTGLFKKARWWIKKQKLTFADQSALIRSTVSKKVLPQRFNDQKFLHKHTVVRHFSKRLFWLPYPHTDNIKQWHIDKVHSVFGYRQFDDIYSEYLKITDIPQKEKK